MYCVAGIICLAENKITAQNYILEERGHDIMYSLLCSHSMGIGMTGIIPVMALVSC